MTRRTTRCTAVIEAGVIRRYYAMLFGERRLWAIRCILAQLSTNESISVDERTRGIARMIRPVFTEVALFLVPFVVYAVFLWGTRAGVLDPTAWSPARLAWLMIAALSLMVGSFVVLAQFSGAHRPARLHVPAHVDDGRLRPGVTK